MVGAAQFIADIDCIRSAIGDAVKGADDIMGIHLRTATPWIWATLVLGPIMASELIFYSFICNSLK